MSEVHPFAAHVERLLAEGPVTLHLGAEFLLVEVDDLGEALVLFADLDHAEDFARSRIADRPDLQVALLKWSSEDLAGLAEHARRTGWLVAVDPPTGADDRPLGAVGHPGDLIGALSELGRATHPSDQPLPAGTPIARRHVWDAGSGIQVEDVALDGAGHPRS